MLTQVTVHAMCMNERLLCHVAQMRVRPVQDHWAGENKGFPWEGASLEEDIAGGKSKKFGEIFKAKFFSSSNMACMVVIDALSVFQVSLLKVLAAVKARRCRGLLWGKAIYIDLPGITKAVWSNLFKPTT